MKTINFTSNEKKFVLELLIAREAQYLEDDAPTILIKAIRETICKIKSGWDNSFLKNHKSQTTSCVNEYLYRFDDKIEFYNKLPTIGFTRLNEQQMQEINLIDQCHAILYKTGYRKSKIRYSDIFEKIEKIEKIKRAEWVGLSRTDAKDVYKIGFKCENETIQWEMSSDVNLLYEEFTKGTKKWFAIFPEMYSVFMKQEEAVKIIVNSAPHGANQNTLELTKYLLT